MPRSVLRKRQPRYPLTLEPLERRVTPANIFWCNPDGGDWDMADNWCGGVLPGPDDTAVLAVEGTPTITHGAGDHLVRALRNEEDFYLTGGTLRLTPGVNSVVDGPVTLAGGTLENGNITFNGPFTWTGGTFRNTSGAGRTILNGDVLLAGEETRTLDNRVLELAAYTLWTGGDTVFSGAGLFLNRAGAVFEAQAAARFVATGRAAISNQGTFVRAGNFDATGFEDSGINNEGTVDVQAGTLTLTGGSSVNGTFLVQEGAELRLEHSSRTGLFFGDGARIQGGGTVVFHNQHPETSFLVSLGGTYDVTGATVLRGEGTTVRVGAVVQNVGEFILDNAKFDYQRAGALTLSSLTLAGDVNAAQLLTRGDVTITGLFTWLGGSLYPTGTIRTEGGLWIDGPDMKSIGRGQLHNTIYGVWAGTGNVLAFGTFVNPADAILELPEDGQFSGNFTNAGTLVKVTPGTTTFIVSTFLNTGTVIVETGLLQTLGFFTNRGSVYLNNDGGLRTGNVYTQTTGLTQLNGGYLHAFSFNEVELQGGTLAGIGAILGNLRVRNGATVSPGTDEGGVGTTGWLWVEGTYQQFAGSTLLLDLSGPAEGQFDQVFAANESRLAGNVVVSLIDGYQPVEGDLFPVIYSGNMVGGFTTHNLPDLGPDLELVPAYDSASLTLVTAARSPGPESGGFGDLGDEDFPFGRKARSVRATPL